VVSVYLGRDRSVAGTGDVLKLFKKTLSLNGSSPSFTIEKKNECSCVLSILGFLHFLPEKSGTRLADVLRYYFGDVMAEDRLSYAG
jgi:hypothetical protein